jgi:hypothetical protein
MDTQGGRKVGMIERPVGTLLFHTSIKRLAQQSTRRKQRRCTRRAMSLP